jgi:putative transposase
LETKGLKTKDQWRISDELWLRLESLLPVHKPKAHPLGCHRQREDNRKVLDGIFFVLRTGCPWKALDATGICSGSTAHTRFQEWTRAGFFHRLWQESLLEYDQLKKIDWRWLALDGATTKAPLGGGATGPNPTDRAKKGTKRSLLTDAKGMPVGLAVEGANRHDMKMVEATLQSIPPEVEARRLQALEQKKQRLCMDKGYDFKQVRDLVEEFGFEAHIRSRGEENKEKKRSKRFRARRWVVERTHSWMNRHRRILIRWEKKTENYLAMLHFACATIIWNACLFG